MRSLSRFPVLVLALSTLSIPAASAQNWFTAPRSYPEIESGRFVLVADMDSDGTDDAVWASASAVQVWRGFGGELVPGPVTPAAIEGPHVTIPPVAGDVDGDGVTDLVFGRNDPFPAAKLVVLLGRPGLTFSPPIVIDLTGPTSIINGDIQAVAVGQIDGDPALEIAEAHDMSPGLTTNALSEVTWWDWNGASFVAGPALPLAGPLHSIFSMVALDVDQDGDDDLLAAGTSKTGPPGYVLLRTSAGGATIGASFTPGGAGRLTAGDVDGDGDVDAVAVQALTQPTRAAVTLFATQGGSFVVTTSPPVPVDQPGTWTARAALGDWDGDGISDVVLAHENATVLRNTGAGAFTLFGEAEIEGVASFFGPPAGVADVDVDGLPDLVGPRSILFGDGGPPADAPLLGAGPISVGGGLFDDEGDGDVDYLLSDGVLRNDGTGSFVEVPAALPALPQNLLLGDEGARGDFDGDGFMDALHAVSQVFGPFDVQFAGMALLPGDACGHRTFAGLVSAPAQGKIEGDLEGSVRGVDLDGDGDLDLPFGGVWRNDGLGLGWTVVPIPLAEAVRAAADVDLDGDVDLLTTRAFAGGAVLTLQRNTGAGLSFQAQDLVAGAASDAFSPARFVDLDDDSDLDVAGAGGTGLVAAYVIENQGGVFVAPVPLGGGAGVFDRLAAADADGDGKTDLVAQRRHPTVGGATWLEVHRRTSGLQYEAPRDWAILAVSGFADVDGDGDRDAFGSRIVRSRLAHGPSAGTIRQYGTPIVGSGGTAPVVGASGPLSPTTSTAALRVRRVLGGAFSILFVGLAATEIPNALPGGPFLVLPPLAQVPFVAPGPLGLPCGGALTLDLTAVAPSLAGVSVFSQLLVADASAPGGVASSQGLELTFGF